MTSRRGRTRESRARAPGDVNARRQRAGAPLKAGVPYRARPAPVAEGASSGTRPRRVGGEAPIPALRPVVSSPPPSEPDMRLPPHPALHEHNERFLARAAEVGHGVPAAIRQRCAGVHRRPPPMRSCRVLTGPLRPVDGSPALLGGALLPRLLRVLRHAPAATADGAPAPDPPTRVRRAPPGRFPRSLIRRSAGSAPSCTPGTSPRATASRHAASPARASTGRARRPPARTRTEHPDSP
jgi:hypothetical protein